MKKLLITSILIAIAFFPTVAISQSNKRENITFICDKIKGIPTTIAQRGAKKTPIFVWNSPELGESPDTPQESCEKVTAKLQNYYNQGQFNYLTTGRDCPQGRKSCRTFVCAVEKENEGCRGRLLFPLQLRDDYDTPNNSLQRLLGINLNFNPPIDETPPSIYINLGAYLNGNYTRR